MTVSDTSGDHMGPKILWAGRTHFKVLAKPFFIQLFLLAVHIFLGFVLPTNTGWDWWNAWGPFTLHALILLIELWYVVIPVLQWLNANFEVTEESVIARWGVIYKHSREIPLNSIVSVATERGILDRIFGAGTLVFYDAAAGYQPETSGVWNRGRGKESKSGIRFSDVPRALEVQKVIEAARMKARRASRD